jgi:hypothetical protein
VYSYNGLTEMKNIFNHLHNYQIDKMAALSSNE